MAQVFSNSLYPPDNSGEWYDDGWGGWVKDVTVVGQVPVGYEDDGWGVLVKTEANPTIDKTTETNVRKAITDAKTFGETKVGRVLADILDYGLPVVKKLIDAGVIKNANAPITLSNIDVDKANDFVKKGGAAATKTIEVPKPPETPNSTFFGIDFSNGLNIALLVLALIGLWMLISRGGNDNNSQAQSVPQKSIKRTGQRRLVTV